MELPRSGALGLGASLALCAALLASGRGQVIGGEGGAGQATGAPEAPLAVDATELWSHPGRHLGRELRFQVRFKDWLADWPPFLTRFGPANYRALVGWGEREFPWEPERFTAPRVRVFVRRGDAAEWALEEALPYDTFEVVGRVRAVFAGEPWVEVTGVVPVLHTIPEGSVLHASRALGLIGKEHWDRAEEELERALAAPLPEVASAELRRLQQLCRDASEAESTPLERAHQRAREGTR